jgi:hypothetical protein
MRLLTASLTACSAVLLIAALAGCGGGNEASPEPRIEPAAAQRLASLSDEVAELSGQDDCAAAHRADDLYVAARDAAAQGQVPVGLRQELITKATELRDELNCEQPPPPPPPDEDDDHDNGKRKDKGKRRGGDEG